jgi:hypothetical protein
MKPSNELHERRPIHLWIVGVASLLWNATGCFDYLATKLPIESYVAQFSEAQLAYLQALPAWFTAFWALGVWGALAGSIALLLASRWAVQAFSVSLIGLIVTTTYTVLFTDGLAAMGAAGAAFSGLVFVVAVLLLIYARRQKTRGVLN